MTLFTAIPANGAPFSIGRLRIDGQGPFRFFTVYGRSPWQGILAHDGRQWYYTGDCWPL